MDRGRRPLVDSSLARSTLAWLVAACPLAPGCFDPSQEALEGPAAAGTTDDDDDDDGRDDDDDDGEDDGDDDDDDENEADDDLDDAAESSGGGETGSSDDVEEACAEYCGIMEDHCEGELAQYDGTAVCEAACANMPLGTPDDALGNTVGCRTFHGLLAARSPDPHCRHAGPAGAGTCGASCESFCSLALTACDAELAPYPDADSCIAACEAFPTEPPFSAEVPDADTFACRLRHLTLAAAQPELHCAHIGPTSPVCVD